MIRDFATVLIRFLAAYIIFTALMVSFQQVVWANIYPDTMLSSGNYAQLSPLFILILWLAAGALMWRYAGVLSRLLTGEKGEQGLSIEASDIVVAGSFLIGAYWLLLSLSEFISRIIIEYGSDTGVNVYFGIRNVVLMVLAVSMMLGAKWIGAQFTKLRKLGPN